MRPENSTFFAEKYDDENEVSELISRDGKFIGILSSMLDTEMNGWKSLALHFEIIQETTVQFGLPGPGPTAELFSYMSTTDSLKDLTVGELRKHFEAMQQQKLVNILPKDKGLCFNSHIINLSRLWSCVLGFSSVLTFFYLIHVQPWLSWTPFST